eukprot:TRINITY_DN17237_c0_g1_i1.p1 TRINITY_DN17237_c0_g1~~TRINITY_DN17237_c0_g1_i1.p1  ORF type:complete len:170 (+),score=10.48 TRINITY_DN17237_c0_g1_i1:271-780(+)
MYSAYHRQSTQLHIYGVLNIIALVLLSVGVVIFFLYQAIVSIGNTFPFISGTYIFMEIFGPDYCYDDCTSYFVALAMSFFLCIIIYGLSIYQTGLALRLRDCLLHPTPTNTTHVYAPLPGHPGAPVYYIPTTAASSRHHEHHQQEMGLVYPLSGSFSDPSAVVCLPSNA